MVGARKSNKLEPHNLAMTLTGTGMLWVGWFGFNAGSALTAGAGAAMAMAVTQISAATAALTWMFLDLSDPAVGKPTSLGVATGAVAGLASITPAAGFVGPLGGLCIGLMGGVICRYFATAVKAAGNYDDTLDVFGVHGVGGFVGTLALAVFAHPSFGGNQVGNNTKVELGCFLKADCSLYL
jgi:ammonia channel protein AmtB